MRPRRSGPRRRRMEPSRSRCSIAVSEENSKAPLGALEFFFQSSYGASLATRKPTARRLDQESSLGAIIFRIAAVHTLLVRCMKPSDSTDHQGDRQGAYDRFHPGWFG